MSATYQIAPEIETLVPFDEIPTLIKGWLPGKQKVSKAAVYRWHRSGVGGVHLPSILIAGTRYSSGTACKWFFTESSAARQHKHSNATKSGIRKAKLDRVKEARELGI